MRTKKFIHVFAALLIAGFIFQSCNKTTTPAPDNTTGMEKLNVPDGFHFESTEVEHIIIDMPKSLDFDLMKSRFNIYTNDPAKGGKLITSGGFDENGQFEGDIRVPTAMDSVFVQTIAGNIMAALTSQEGTKAGGVIINFGEDYGYGPPDTIEPAGKSAFRGTINTISGTSANYNVQNLISNGDFETDDYGIINDWDSPHPIDGRWYITQHSGSMEWYNEEGNHVFRTPWTEPGNYFFGGVSQMISAKAGDVITFSADIKSVGDSAHLYSRLDFFPRNAYGNILGYYHVNYYHPSSTWTRKTLVATMPPGTVTCQVLVWTFDFYPEAAVYVDNVVVTGPVADADADGVDDSMDDYPNDASRAFNVYYPNETDWGTVAFEDLWPGTGDYDFNDLVLDYHYKSVLNSSNELVEFYTDYSVRAVGASLENGFGIMLGGDPANIASVSGTHYTENYIHNNANGTEQGQSNSVIILFDNSFRMIGSSGSTFINTKQEIPYVNPDTNTLHVVYQNPVSTNVTGTAPYNPFLIINKERGKEIHLAGQEPTDLVNTSYFGTMADDTKPSEGKYYQTANNLPWAIDLPVSFAYPLEQVEILNAYNHFSEWATSSGVQYPDWYQDKEGYRVPSNIFAPPALK